MKNTYRGFETYTDAKIFRDFLVTHGFNYTVIEKTETWYKVHYTE